MRVWVHSFRRENCESGQTLSDKMSYRFRPPPLWPRPKVQQQHFCAWDVVLGGVWRAEFPGEGAIFSFFDQGEGERLG